MPMLPVPIFVALVLAYLTLRAALGGGRPLLILLLAAATWQSLAVALVSGYAMETLRPLLPVTATAIPPLVWVTFRTGLFGGAESRVIHVAAPALTLLFSVFASEALDVLVSGVFVGYGSAILVALGRMGDMPLTRLESGEVPARIWRALGWVLIISALADGLIAAAFLAGRQAWIGWIITVFSSAMLLALGLLSASPLATGETDERAGHPIPTGVDEADRAEDVAIVAQLDDFLAREALHLNPGLTLRRLSQRLHVPEKRLSAAVNRATGGNVSRHINGWRIRHACTLLDQGEGVTQAMLDSGFNTKSNFNREFRRLTGASPSDYRDRHAPPEP